MHLYIVSYGGDGVDHSERLVAARAVKATYEEKAV